ncbi:TPA: glutamine synthetase, partial [bacterium]|nr:glutamine synthetase [bacterium]
MQHKELIERVKEDKVRFISLQFTDVTGMVKSVDIPSRRLEEALEDGVWFDGSSIEGFARIQESDMRLVIDAQTYAVLPWTPQEGVVNPPAIHPEAGWGPPIQFPGPVEPNGPFFAYGRGLYGNPCGTAPLYPCCTLEEALRIGCRFAPAIDPEARACNITWEWMESIGWNVPYGWHGDYIEEEYDLYHGLFLRETGDKGFNVGAGEFAESFRAVEEALDALRIRNEEYDVYYTLFLKGPGGESFNDIG